MSANRAWGLTFEGELLESGIGACLLDLIGERFPGFCRIDIEKV